MLHDKVWIRDTVERVVATYLQTVLGLLIAVQATDLSIDFLQAAAMSGVPAALAVLKAAIARKVPGTMSPSSLARS